MKIIINQLKGFIKMYTIQHWIVLLLFCSISVYANYGLGMQKYINTLNGFPEFFAFMLMYAVHIGFALLLYSLSTGNYKFWTQFGFIFLQIFAIAVFSARAVLYQHKDIIDVFSSEGNYSINRTIYGDVFRFLYLVVPVFIFWFIKDRKEMPFYGFSFKNHKQKIYWILLACMIPLLIGASFLSDFLEYYPRFRKLSNMNASSIDIAQFELFYGIDFISIELFFRGFLIMGCLRYIGIHSVLPMAVFYLSIHYGKPIGEAISSFFGGSILGVIAFYSRSIYGGIMVHVGIAWLMELGAYIGNVIRGTWPNP